MICEAKKQAAYSAEALTTPATVENRAVSIRASFNAISKIAGLAIPLRRPNRRQPSREVEQEYADAHLAKQALADVEGIVPYSEFRKELGLND
jgi:hypothetical protein